MAMPSKSLNLLEREIHRIVDSVSSAARSGLNVNPVAKGLKRQFNPGTRIKSEERAKRKGLEDSSPACVAYIMASAAAV